jgi:protein-disulfide isomerase
MRLILLTASLLVSSFVHATAIENIKVFHTNDIPVIQDISLNGIQQLEVFNMDTKDYATAKLNRLMQQLHARMKKTDDYLVSYSEAFDEVLNGPSWDGIYTDLELGSKAIEFAIRYQVKKTPAIVFNDSSVVYGVTSLKEAIRIYNNKGRIE